jgi:hypothetical protein
MTMMSTKNLQQDDADPAKKRQKGGRRKGTAMKSSRTELESYQNASAEAAQDYQNAFYRLTGRTQPQQAVSIE